MPRLQVDGTSNQPATISCDSPDGCLITTTQRLRLRGTIRVPSNSGPLFFLHTGRSPVVVGGDGTRAALSVTAPNTKLTLGPRGYYVGYFAARSIQIHDAVVILASSRIQSALDELNDSLRSQFSILPPSPAVRLPLTTLPSDSLARLHADLGDGALVATFGSLDFSGFFVHAADASTLMAHIFPLLESASIDASTLRGAAAIDRVYSSPHLQCGEGATITPGEALLGIKPVLQFWVPFNPPGIEDWQTFLCADNVRDLSSGTVTQGVDLSQAAGTLIHELLHVVVEISSCLPTSTPQQGCGEDPAFRECLVAELGRDVVAKTDAALDRKSGDFRLANSTEPGCNVANVLKVEPEWTQCFQLLGLHAHDPCCGNGRPELSEQCDDGMANGTPLSCCDSKCLNVAGCVANTSTSTTTTTSSSGSSSTSATSSTSSSTSSSSTAATTSTTLLSCGNGVCDSIEDCRTCPSDCGFCGPLAYISTSDGVYVIDAGTNTLAYTAQDVCTGHQDLVDVTRDGRRAYFACNTVEGAGVAVFDAGTRAPTGVGPSVAIFVGALAARSDDRHVYVAGGSAGTQDYDSQCFNAPAVISYNLPDPINALAVNLDGTRLYTLFASGTLTVH